MAGPPLVRPAWNQGWHRILYTMHDEELVKEVLECLRLKFKSMIRWYNKMVNQVAKKKKQGKMDTFLKRRESKSRSSSSSSSNSSNSSSTDKAGLTCSTSCEARKLEISQTHRNIETNSSSRGGTGKCVFKMVLVVVPNHLV